MSRTFTFRCNLPKRRPRKADGKLQELSTFGSDRNVNLVIDDIARVFQRHLDGRIADVLDIAAFVYAADSAVPRNGAWTDEGTTEAWARTFSLEIGVRDHAFWTRPDVQKLLSRTLGFVADDAYRFAFEPLRADQARQEYLNFGPAAPDDWPFHDPPRVLLFSGGLDSLAGAVERAARGEKLVLVSHRSVSTIDHRQQELYRKLGEMYPDTQMLRVPVWINKTGNGRSREYTQRTRSFLFWALALAVGTSVNAGGITFFENGVVSLNLPIADQVLRARASRTTHPVALHMLQELSTLVTERPFVVENPYILMTKADVVQMVVRHGAGDLIQHSCSCTRTHAQHGVGWHCGCCSQCIDRRLAMIASGCTGYDPETDYRVPVLTGARDSDTDQTMAFSYVRHAHELSRMSHEQVAERFNTEVSRAARAFPNPTQAAHDLIDMHLRHGQAVRQAIAASVSAHSMELLDGELAPTSLLGLTINRQHLQVSWKRLAERIGDILERGLPLACQSHRPRNEPHLQEICDGLLKGADEKLVREYPYLRWASRMTKPDWSDEAALLWIELKYIRASSDVRKAGEEIAADITKYGDNARRTLFAVYDPSGFVTDQQAFASDICRHAGNLARVIR
jgi:hypothetical protein